MDTPTGHQSFATEEQSSRRPRDGSRWMAAAILAGAAVGAWAAVASWHSVGDGDVAHAGSLELRAPGGKAAGALASLFGEDPPAQIREDLQTLNETLERDATDVPSGA